MPSKFPATFSDTWLVALYQFPSTGTWPFTCFILEKLPTGRESGKLFSTHPNPSQSNPIINHPPPRLSVRDDAISHPKYPRPFFQLYLSLSPEPSYFSLQSSSVVSILFFSSSPPASIPFAHPRPSRLLTLPRRLVTRYDLVPTRVSTLTLSTCRRTFSSFHLSYISNAPFDRSPDLHATTQSGTCHNR